MVSIPRPHVVKGNPPKREGSPIGPVATGPQVHIRELVGHVRGTHGPPKQNNDNLYGCSGKDGGWMGGIYTRDRSDGVWCMAPRAKSTRYPNSGNLGHGLDDHCTQPQRCSPLSSVRQLQLHPLHSQERWVGKPSNVETDLPFICNNGATELSDRTLNLDTVQWYFCIPARRILS